MVECISEEKLIESREISHNLVKLSADANSNLIDYVDKLSVEQTKLALLRICCGGYSHFSTK